MLKFDNLHMTQCEKIIPVVGFIANVGYVFTATCFSNVAVMPSLDVRLSVCPSVRNVGEH